LGTKRKTEGNFNKHTEARGEEAEESIQKNWRRRKKKKLPGQAGGELGVHHYYG